MMKSDGWKSLASGKGFRNTMEHSLMRLSNLIKIAFFIGLATIWTTSASAQPALTFKVLRSVIDVRDTLPLMTDGQAPQNFDEMWSGFGPRAEPLEIETLKQ
jgi:hypothetical protein